jgi:hypothetical protein
MNIPGVISNWKAGPASDAEKAIFWMEVHGQIGVSFCHVSLILVDTLTRIP